jgi:Concanavalin A-like lectin/glucanases superfamily
MEPTASGRSPHGLRYGVVTAALAVFLFVLTAGSASGRSTTVADWEMNEPAGATVMHDASGNGLNGKISSQAASEGLTLHTSHYRWSKRCAVCEPVASARVVRVPDNDRLDIPHPKVAYALTVKFRTTKPGGNYVQKGQATTAGGQIKVQAWHGIVQCQFKGANGVGVNTGSGRRLDDGHWHIVRCVHTARKVREYVDGRRVDVATGRTGYINNAKPFTIGGKLDCDQTKVECDYYSGGIGYVRVSKR